MLGCNIFILFYPKSDIGINVTHLLVILILQQEMLLKQISFLFSGTVKTIITSYAKLQLRPLLAMPSTSKITSSSRHPKHAWWVLLFHAKLGKPSYDKFETSLTCLTRYASCLEVGPIHLTNFLPTRSHLQYTQFTTEIGATQAYDFKTLKLF